MRTIDRYSRIQALGRPVLTTGEAAVAWETSLPVAARSLARLASSGLIAKIRHGIWQIGAETPDPAIVLPVLTNPYPSYISGWSALARHGMIEQIPRGVYAASLDRAKTVETAFGRYEIHHIHPDLYGGFEGGSGIRAGVATPEKALFDTVYLLVPRGGRVTLPELELPSSFDEEKLWSWLEHVRTARLRSLTRTGLERALEARAAIA